MRTCHYCKQPIDDDTLTVCPCGAGLPAADPKHPPLVADPAGNPDDAPPHQAGDLLPDSIRADLLAVIGWTLMEYLEVDTDEARFSVATANRLCDYFGFKAVPGDGESAV